MQTRRRFKQTTSLQDRLSEFIAGARAEAETAPGGADEYELRKKIRSCSRRSDKGPSRRRAGKPRHHI